MAFLTCLLVMIFISPDSKSLGNKEKTKPYSIKRILSNRIILGIFVMRFFAASGQGAVYTFLPILAMQLGLSSTQVGIVLTMNIFLIAFLQRPCGRLADRINPKYLVITGTFASGMTVFGMQLVDGFMLILGLNILMGIANGISLPGGLVITGRMGRTMGMASIMSLNDAAWSLGMIVSPILSGMILDVLGISYVFIIGSLLILIGGIVVTIFLWNYEHNINFVTESVFDLIKK